jgi:hypothetical protein
MFEETERMGKIQRVERSSQDETDWAATVGKISTWKVEQRFLAEKKIFFCG